MHTTAAQITCTFPALFPSHFFMNFMLFCVFILMMFMFMWRRLFCNYVAWNFVNRWRYRYIAFFPTIDTFSISVIATTNTILVHCCFAHDWRTTDGALALFKCDRYAIFIEELLRKCNFSKIYWTFCIAS